MKIFLSRWLMFGSIACAARAAQNITVDDADGSRTKYLPTSEWANVKSFATLDRYNNTATKAQTIGAQVSLSFYGTAIYWQGYGSSNKTQYVNIIVDDVTTVVDVSIPGLGPIPQTIAWWRTDLLPDCLHTIVVRTTSTEDLSATLFHDAFIYTEVEEGVAKPSTERFTIEELTSTTRPVTVLVLPSANIAPVETPISGGGQHSENTGLIVGGSLTAGLGLGILFGGLCLWLRRRRLRRRKAMDSERAANPFVDSSIAAAEARLVAISRAHFDGVEPFVLSRPEHTGATPWKEKATLVEDQPTQQNKSRSPSPVTRLPLSRPHPPGLVPSRPPRPPRSQPLNSRLTPRPSIEPMAQIIQTNNRRAPVSPVTPPKSALPPYPGSPSALPSTPAAHLSQRHS